MRYQEVSPSRLPSLLVPCPLCVHRMVITTVEPALLADGAASNDARRRRSRPRQPRNSAQPGEWAGPSVPMMVRHRSPESLALRA